MDYSKTIGPLRTALGWMGEQLGFAGHLLGLKEIADLFKSGMKPSTPDLSAKGLKGIFGLGDEGALEVLLLAMTPKKRQAIKDYMVWAFTPPEGASPKVEMVFWYFRNRFRVHIVGLPKTEKKEVPKKVVTTRKLADGTEETITIDGQTTVEGINIPLQWLNNLAAKILEEKDETKKISHFQRIKAEHIATTDVPYAPDDPETMASATAWVLSELGRTLARPVTSLNEAVKNSALNTTENNKQRTWPVRLILSMLP